jgi:hypothetical protein
MGFKVHTWQLGLTLRLTSTPRAKNSTSMGLGPNSFPHVVTTTTTMTIGVQFETLALQRGPYYNASWHVGKCTIWCFTF